MTNYVICERSLHHAHAGSKARDDIRQILETNSWHPFEVHPGENKGYIDKLICIQHTVSDWHKLSNAVNPGDLVFVQFPLIMYNKVSLFALSFIDKMKDHGVRFIFLIHDLESLRGYSYTDFDKRWISKADIIISHNKRMSEVLREYGATAPIIELGIFDYLLPTVNPVPVMQRHGIDIAGNLSHKKAEYIYQLGEHFPHANINLYGPNFDRTAGPTEWYRGVCTPDELPSKLSGRFGLIWDGDSYHTCSGCYGKYLTINNPHKLSLYLAANKPVMIWNQAALAPWIEEHGAGIAVDDIEQAISIERDITNEQYLSLTNRASELGERIRKGWFTEQAMHKIQTR